MKFQLLALCLLLLTSQALAMEQKVVGKWKLSNGKEHIAFFDKSALYDRAKFLWKPKRNSNFATLTLFKNGRKRKKYSFFPPKLFGKEKKEFTFSRKEKGDTTFFKPDTKSKKSGILERKNGFLHFSLADEVLISLTAHFPEIKISNLEIIEAQK